MKFLDYIHSTPSTENSCKSIINAMNQSKQSITQDDLAYLLAEKIVEHRCRRCDHHFKAWKNKVENGQVLPQSSSAALKAFLEPSFGTLDNTINIDHLEGFVGEWLWYFLFKELTDFPIKFDIPPGFLSTDPGGDGFIIHTNEQIGLFFRIWEVKKFSPRSSSSTQRIESTIKKAYSQLNSKASQYLARITSSEQVVGDDEVEKFIGEILDYWIESTDQASVGVSIATSECYIKRNCFNEFSLEFPDFENSQQLMGMITGVLDFRKFSQKVQETIWKGM